jgi:hypothetical protein
VVGKVDDHRADLAPPWTRALTGCASRLTSYFEAGDQIVALGQMYARGRSTGGEGQIPLALVFTAGQDGKLIRYESSRNTEALEAVGLRE